MNVSYVSPLQEQDRLMIQINPFQTFFQGINKPFKYLDHSSTKLQSRIPKQIKKTHEIILINQSTTDTKIVIIFAIVLQVLMSSIFKNSFKYMVSMINALQFIFHFPIMNIVFPANVMNFFNIMIPIVMFDVLSDIP